MRTHASMGEKKIRIVDIAQLAGVSPGTVDRVIHNRGRIAPDKKERIEKIIRQLDYKPNITARLLARGESFAIAVVAPSYDGESYWKQVSEGVLKAAEELGQGNIKIDFIRFDQYNRSSFDVAIANVDWGRYNGVIIATLFEERVKILSVQLDAISLPYIYIDSHVEGQSNIAYFGVDAQASGYIAGKMLCREIEDDAPIVITHVRFRRNEISTQMRKRENGLLQYFHDISRREQVIYIEHDPNQPELTISAFDEIIKRYSNLIGVVVLNSRAYELVDFLEQRAGAICNHLVIAGFEAIKPNIEAMNRGRIRLLISQRPELQGFNAVKALSNLFLLNAYPSRINYTPIDILIPENIGYYSD